MKELIMEFYDEYAEFDDVISNSADIDNIPGFIKNDIESGGNDLIEY